MSDPNQPADPFGAGLPAPDHDASGSGSQFRTARMAAGASGEVPKAVPDSAEARVGRKLGKYRLVRLIGQGGMGIVYEGLDLLMQRPVAMKLLRDEVATDRDTVLGFVSEARAAGRLNHPNVVGVHEVDARENTCYIVMELVNGASVAEFLRDNGPFPWREATRIIADTCRGLAHAHAAGLIHRDIKPGNILRGIDGAVKLTDFGLARAADAAGRAGAGAGSGLRVPSMVLGTPQFMSPEQAHGLPLDARSDLYSLGTAYYTLLTGHSPFADAVEDEAIMQAHCFSPVPDPRVLVPDLPEGCVTVLTRVLAKNPDERYQTAVEMLADLDGLLSGAGLVPRSAAFAVPAPSAIAEPASAAAAPEPLPLAQPASDVWPVPPRAPNASVRVTRISGRFPARRRQGSYVWVLFLIVPVVLAVILIRELTTRGEPHEAIRPAAKPIVRPEPDPAPAKPEPPAKAEKTPKPEKTGKAEKGKPEGADKPDDKAPGEKPKQTKKADPDDEP